MQTGVFRQTLSEKGKNTDTSECREGPGSRQGFGKNDNQTSNRAREGQLASNICQSNVCVNEGGLLMETCDKFEVLEPTHPGTTFQDVVHQDSQGPPHWMIKLDLKDTYLSVPLYHHHRKFETDESSGSNFEEARNQSHFTPRRHADQGTNEGGKKYLVTALELLIALGFMINTKKCARHSDQVMEFLGFVLDSRMSTESEAEILTEDSKQT